MHDGIFRLLASRRFLPLFVAQFLGAANDNVFKNALVILVVYRLGSQGGLAPQVLVTMAAGLFILPFFLFSATAGQLSDRLEKSRLLRLVKLAEVAVAVLAVWALATANVAAMMAVLFLFGLQATFFGPLKYAVLPEYLAETELIGGNALIEGGTFLAILLGTIAGGVLVVVDGGIAIVSVLVVVLALGGFAASLFLPKAHPGKAEVLIGANIWRETMGVLTLIRQRRDVFLSVLGISWFWLVGGTYLAQLPAFAKTVLGADEHAVTLMLTVFSLGIGIGSVLCGWLLKGEISARHVPFAALGMSVFALDLWLASGSGAPDGTTLAGLGAFLARPGTWRVLADLLGLAIAGGIYIVPLYAILQARSDEAERARAIAANNIMNAAFMVVSAVAAAAMLVADFTVPQVFLAVAVANLGAALYICRLLPDTVLKGLFAWVLRALYKVEVRGLENWAASGPRAVVVVNHASFLDAFLMAAFLPDKPIFAIDSAVARLWWVKPFLSMADTYPLEPSTPMALKGLIRAVRGNRVCVLFPEGRITTGDLMKIYEGPGLIADRAAAPLVPVRIDGTRYTPFSRPKGKARLRWFVPITITILPPQRFEIAAEVKGRARRQRIGTALAGRLR